MESLESRARAVRITFWLLILVYGAAFLSDLAMVSFLNDVKNGGFPDEAYAETLDARQAAFGIAQVLVLIACAIAFCSWFAQAHRNLGAAGVENLKYSPGWAVGGFFVPFLNLVRPYQVMKEVWAGSASLAGSSQTESRQAQQPPIIGWWWALFLISSLVDNLSARFMLGAEEIDALIASGYVTAFADIFNLPAAFAALTLVGRLTELQQSALSSTSPTPSIR